MFKIVVFFLPSTLTALCISGKRILNLSSNRYNINDSFHYSHVLCQFVITHQRICLSSVLKSWTLSLSLFPLPLGQTCVISCKVCFKCLSSDHSLLHFHHLCFIFHNTEKCVASYQSLSTEEIWLCHFTASNFHGFSVVQRIESCPPQSD